MILLYGKPLAAVQFKGGLKYDRLGGTYPMETAQFPFRRMGQPVQIAIIMIEDALGQSDRRLFWGARTDKDGQEFCIGKRIRSKKHHFFPGPFRGDPFLDGEFFTFHERYVQRGVSQYRARWSKWGGTIGEYPNISVSHRLQDDGQKALDDHGHKGT
ncbi:MAG: hypothetical protein NXH90_13405 [Flavobacteriaceae bacterium]|nr:hypothetical protein [Flavobacteriaceae bacterium]